MLALKLKKVCGYLMARIKIHFGTNKSNNSFESEKLKKSAIEIATYVLDISGEVYLFRYGYQPEISL